MATDGQSEGPPATDVERVFAEWEECFQRHKQELQALRSPQQEYKAKVDAIDARISQWWAAYDEMSSAEKQQERDSLGLLFTEKSSLAGRYQSTLEAQQAVYERRQRQVFQRLHAAVDGLVRGHWPDGTKRNDPDTDRGSQIEDSTRVFDSEAEVEEDPVENIGDSEGVSDDDNSEEEGHAVTPKGNTEKANEEGRKRRRNRSSRFSSGGRAGMRTAESPETKMRGQRGRLRGRLRGRPRGRARGRGRSETMSGRTRSGGCGDEPTDDAAQETLGPGWRQVGSVFRHGPEPSRRRAPRAERDDSEENTYVRRAPGEVCLAYFGDNAVKTPILILPLNDMESIGISENLSTLHLDEDMPKCCLFSSRSQKYQWARGYEDDGRLESNREYPVLCLISSQLKKCPASWVAGCDMISVQDDEVGWKLNHHYHEACDVLRKIKLTPARNTDDIQNHRNSTPLLEVADTMRTNLLEKGKSNPEPERSTQPETFSDPNGGPLSEETTSGNVVHPNDKIESESTAQDSESGTASKNALSSFSAETGQARHESGGFEESYLENLAHTSLNYARNKADMMEGGNCETSRPQEAATGHFTFPSIAGEHPAEQLGEHRPSASSIPPIVGAQAPGGETSNVAGPNPQEASPRTRAQIGEMFHEIERHMAKRQIPVHWASGPPGLSSQASTTAQSYQASSTDPYPHQPQTNRHQIPLSQNTPKDLLKRSSQANFRPYQMTGVNSNPALCGTTSTTGYDSTTVTLELGA
ncbi:unnamed protein product [Clonostachys rhizophaga]|uniref:Uncharacterized protein n=1 Tax=Clonostachys rhizophaga TaxID=160324 RepID=A0A9N9YQ88_9HYPO|nr:unnamed protein product [Clonostachys rhizophaga]